MAMTGLNLEWQPRTWQSEARRNRSMLNKSKEPFVIYDLDDC